MGSYSSSTMLLALIILIGIAPHLIATQKEYVCPPGKSNANSDIKQGETPKYRTHDGEEYPPNVSCLLNIKKPKGSNCDLFFYCAKFNVSSAYPSPSCKGGDFLQINKNKYCQTVTSLVRTKSNQLKVLFKTNPLSVGSGAECIAMCIERAKTVFTFGMGAIDLRANGASIGTYTWNQQGVIMTGTVNTATEIIVQNGSTGFVAVEGVIVNGNQNVLMLDFPRQLTGQVTVTNLDAAR